MQTELQILETVRDTATPRSDAMGVRPDSINFCFDLADCPKLTGFLMGGKSALIRPDYERLSRAFSDANWKWTISEAKQRRNPHRSPSDAAAFMEWLNRGEPPGPEDLLLDIADRVEKLTDRPGDYIQSGGIIIFRTLSGGVGCAIDWLLAEHYKRTAPVPAAPAA